MNSLLINKEAKIKEALIRMKKVKSKSLVVSDKEKLLGTVSDGDIRSSFLKGYQINNTISKIYNKKPFFFFDGDYKVTDLNKVFIQKRFDVIPIIDKKKKIIKIFTWEQFYGKSKKKLKKIDLPVIIMSGGKGNRLKPFTEVLPKALIPIDNKAIIEVIIESFFEQNIKNYYLVINYKHEIIKSYFNSIKTKYKVKFIQENKFLGTMGGLSLLKRKIKSDFFVTNCDVIFDIDVGELYYQHKKNKNDITIVVTLKEFKIPYGSCELDDDGNLNQILEKPKLNLFVNTGLYVFNKSILNIIPNEKKYDFDQLINDAKKSNLRIGTFIIDPESWNDVGEWDEYKKTLSRVNITK